MNVQDHFLVTIGRAALLFVLIWSISVVTRNQTNYGELVRAYEALADLYEDALAEQDLTVTTVSQVERLKTDIQFRLDEANYGGVKQNLLGNYVAILVSLLGLELLNWLSRQRKKMPEAA